MQLLEISGAVRPIYMGRLGVKRLSDIISLAYKLTSHKHIGARREDHYSTT